MTSYPVTRGLRNGSVRVREPMAVPGEVARARFRSLLIDIAKTGQSSAFLIKTDFDALRRRPGDEFDRMIGRINELIDETHQLGSVRISVATSLRSFPIW